MSLRMAWIAPETVAPIKHLVGNFVGAAVLFAAAIALAAMEKWCAAQNMPSYLTTGTRVIAFVLFTLDGILICGTSGIITIRLLRKTWENEN